MHYMLAMILFLIEEWNRQWAKLKTDIDGLVQDCRISSALAMAILQSCNKAIDT